MAEVTAMLGAAREQGVRVLDEPSAKALLAAAGVAVPAGITVRADRDLVQLATLRAPFAIKAISPQIVHKSDSGAVRVGVQDVASTLDQMRRELAAKGFDVPAWLIEEMAPPGVECVVGGVVDADFGPMVMVGLGGIFVEILRDVAFRICPIRRDEAQDMVAGLRGSALLRGARGRTPVATTALIDALVAIGGEEGLLTRHAGEIAEIDLNPLIVGADGAVAVDARIVLAPDRGANLR